MPLGAWIALGAGGGVVAGALPDEVAGGLLAGAALGLPLGVVVRRGSSPG